MRCWSEWCTPLLGGRLLTALIAFRVMNAIVVRTSFTPDEFWQGPEVAHYLAFGQGHLTWEWQPSARIRGFTHPLIFAGVYKILAMLGLDTRWAVAHSAKLVQGALAGVCDYYTFGLAKNAFGTAAAGWALVFQLLSWFNFYCLVRPYSNSAEAVLATASLFYWAPLLLPATAGRRKGVRAIGAGEQGEGGNATAAWGRETYALLLAAVCIAVRPTSAALWTVVGLIRLSTLPLRRWPRYVTLTVAPPVAAVVGASVFLDSRIYGVATFVPFNFLRFNVLEGKSRIFGEQPWHWNFSQGLPAVLGAALPCTLWAFVMGDSGLGGEAGRINDQSARGRARAGGSRILGWIAVWFLVYHSTSPHKEFRFLLPILPIAHAYAGLAVSTALARTFRAGGSESDEGSDTQKASDPKTEVGLELRFRQKWRRCIVAALFFLHVPAALYLSFWHQSGALAAVDVVAEKVSAMASTRSFCERPKPVFAQVTDDLDGKSEATRLVAEGGGSGEGEPTKEKEKGAVKVHFLMPCHSAPLHSHLHFPHVETDLWSLDCSPDNRARIEGSESDQFLLDPLDFLKIIYGKDGENAGSGQFPSPPPDLAVMYSIHLEKPGMVDFLRRLGLETAAVVFNAHVNGDADSDDMYGSVVVLERVACLAEDHPEMGGKQLETAHGGRGGNVGTLARFHV